MGGGRWTREQRDDLVVVFNARVRTLETGPFAGFGELRLALALALAVDAAADLDARLANRVAHAATMRPGNLRLVLPRLLAALALVLPLVAIFAGPVV